MYDILVIGAGVCGASFACKASKYAKVLLIEAQDYNKKIPERVNIFAEHNKPFIDDHIWKDKEAFPRPFLQLNYKSEKSDGLIDNKEFGSVPIGQITHTEKFIEILIQNAEDQGCETRFNEKISKINKYSDHVEIINSKGESYSTKLLVLATGSKGFDLQRSLGFEVPDSYMGIYLNSDVDESILDENFSFQYMFHLNPNISSDGPFFFNVGKGRVSTGYLGNQESPAQLKDKLDRILQNYEKIQKYIKGISWDLDNIIIGDISKHPINKMTNDRIIVLGESAGLVTPFFYEGMLCGLASADIASKVIEPLLSNNKEFSSLDLVKYDQEIKRLLLDGYFRNGNACEYLFYGNKNSMKSIWNAYTEMLKTNKTVRKFVYDVLMIQDLASYNTDNDKEVGERLFAHLPLLSKATLWPKFLKAMSF
ncbi:MAG: NAD(P)/FAD-dependent oxidoreductase [Promethearchaeota archaeon]